MSSDAMALTGVCERRCRAFEDAVVRSRVYAVMKVCLDEFAGSRIAHAGHHSLTLPSPRLWRWSARSGKQLSLSSCAKQVHKAEQANVVEQLACTPS